MFRFWKQYEQEQEQEFSVGPLSLVRYVILAISVAKIDFIVFMASLGVK